MVLLASSHVAQVTTSASGKYDASIRSHQPGTSPAGSHGNADAGQPLTAASVATTQLPALTRQRHDPGADPNTLSDSSSGPALDAGNGSAPSRGTQIVAANIGSSDST